MVDQEQQSDKAMSLWSHLDELRGRLVKAAATIMVAFAVALAFSTRIVNFLKHPLEAVLPAGTTALHFTGPMDVFMVNIKVAMLIAVVFGAPAWLYQFWKFVEPALYPKERRYVKPFMVASIACFLMGVLFCYYAILPMALSYLIGIGLEVGTPIITITDYISLLTIMILGFGLIFETPVILVLLAMLNIISAETLAANRKIIFVGILIVAAVITPPDPLSMLGMAIPCYLMFEIAILVIRMIKKAPIP
jgi:sec-independent protein translocase protein TatC